jgi:hypothetical protein
VFLRKIIFGIFEKITFQNKNLTAQKSVISGHLQKVDKLNGILAGILPKLRDISEADFAFKLDPKKWSKKEILGHLVDSAANNHQRFIRTQYEDTPSIKYDQDKWVELNDWQNWPTTMIIDFWMMYNRRIIEVIKRIPPDKLTKICKVGDKTFTLDFLIDDYITHLQHHLAQLKP